MGKKSQKTGVFVVLLLLSGVSVWVAGCEKKTPEPRTAEVKIGTNSWVVELAMTQKSRHKGLSGRRELSEGSGMLFIYPEAISLNFCMRECFIPIDIVFIGADLRVVNTYAMQVEPGRRGLANYSSGIPAQYVLELPGDTVEKCGIKNGDLVELVDVPDAAHAETAE